MGISVCAQVKISGTVSSDGKKGRTEIFNKTNGQKTWTNADGSFAVDVEKAGDYELVFFKDGFGIVEKTFAAPSENNEVALEKITNLSEVVVQNQKEKWAALHKLKDVEGTAIYAGRKTEVINIDKITANKATNNTRQVFAQVAGLTINETSDGGLQLSIGGRGLDPNRTSNFNTRQNGYDISADVLGYPESYYATPTEALEEIQIVRGAASLQYGTQFGGLVNFITKKPVAKPFAFLTRNTIGSYGLYTNFTSVSGTPGKFSYYSYFNYKKGDGFRPNSNFESKNFFANLNYQFNAKTALHFDYTYFNYLAHQPGGLTDQMFYDDPLQSNRTRNWFAVDWNLFALRLDHSFTPNAEFSLQLFGLDANRKTVGFRQNRASTGDILGTERDLIVGDFVNWGAEARYLQRYNLMGNKSTFLIGAKYYQSDNKGLQGPGSSGINADFDLATDEFPYYPNQSQYRFPNVNVAFFAENIFKISPRFSITPGLRLEKIRTKAEGYYRKINVDLAGNILLDQTIPENNTKDRHFFLAGIGLSYKPQQRIEFYGNAAMNYRSVTFNDIRTSVPNQVIDAHITDEEGYTSDIGVRGQLSDQITFDTSVFGLYYDGKIGDYLTTDSNNNFVRVRKNIGTAFTYGFEALLDWKINRMFFAQNENFQWNLFSNLSLTDSEYTESEEANIKGNSVEFVPLYNLKTGTGIGYKNFLASLQFTYVSEQFTDANNSTVDRNDNMSGISGKIPAYHVADFSASYKWKNFKLEAGVNNFTDNKYFTRRATGYPGPGIIPSETRSFYATLEFVF
ncbi:TonB-dependent receptor domain-containing protein [Flavobacterium sp.]|uniref:TonB-dependent receptor domain-containing protein n=1 Tax=Flavobacterium sp. TaxID=239 RepID=UPI0039E5B3BA